MSLGGPEGLEAGGAAWGQRGGGRGGRQRGGVLPGRRAETWNARETIEESTEESGTCQPAPGEDGHRQRWTERSSLQRYHLVNNLGYTHIYLSKCIIYTHIYSHTAHLVSILVPCQGLNRCRPLAVKAGSQPLDHWGIPCMLLFILFISPRDVS